MTKNMLLNAIDFASKKHKNQRWNSKDKDSYINHLIDVANFLSRNGIFDETTLVSAILHDIIEHTETTYEELSYLFGKKVASVVMEVSVDKTLTKRRRKEIALANIKYKSLEARLVKLGEKISNTRDVLENPPLSWSELDRDGYIHWSYLICESIFDCGDIDPKIVSKVRDHYKTLGAEKPDTSIVKKYFESL